MKLSAYYKALGAEVNLKLDYENLDTYDKVTISKVFMDTEIPFEPEDKSLKTEATIDLFYKDNPILNLPNVQYGGTGFYYDRSPRLEEDIEYIMPDYGDFGLTTYDSTERYPTSIWKFATDKQKCSLHPTQKPIELCRYAIRTYTNEGDLVVDFCCGSGSILKAAQLENRNYIGIDNGICDRKGKFENWFWADVAKYRLANMDR